MMLFLLVLTLFAGLTIGQTNGDGYVGCFADQSVRDLPFNAGEGHTPTTCNAACLKANYTYFGLQSGAQCFCGHTYGRYGPSYDCFRPCTLAPAFICGDLWTNSVFRVIQPNGVNYLGCYADQSTRDLPHLAGYGLVPSTCNAACLAAGFRYFGLQWGGECYCGQSYGSHGTSNACTHCTNDPRLLCGEKWTNSVYQVTQTNGKGYIGCYADQEDRDLPFRAGDTFHDLSTCNTACALAGYRYFGLQYGGECRCGSTYGKYGTSNACTQPCSLDSRFFCGELWVNSVYTVSPVVDQTHFGSHMANISDAQLLDGIAVLADRLPSGIDPKTLLTHIRTGIPPSLSHFQLQEFEAKRAQVIKPVVCRRSVSSTCVKHMIAVGGDVFALIFAMIGFRGAYNSFPIQESALETEYQREFFNHVGEAFRGGASLKAIAVAVYDLVTNLVSLAGGVGVIVDIITSHLNWWDALQFGVGLASTVLLLTASGGWALIARAAVLDMAIASLILDFKLLDQDHCFSSPQPSLPPPPPIHFTVAVNGQGRPAVFLIDPATSLPLTRSQKLDLSWTPWSSAGLTPPQMTHLAVAQSADSSLELFGIGVDHVTYHTNLQQRNPWFQFGGWATELAATRNPEGNLEAFVIGSNGRAYHVWQDGPNSHGWGSFTGLSGDTPLQDLAVSHNQNGRLQVFGLGTDQAVYTARQDLSLVGGWGPWEYLGGGVASMVTCINQGFIEVFTIGTNQLVYHNWQNGANSPTWHGWLPLFSMQATQLSATQLASGTPIVFALGLDHAVYYNALALSGAWSDWKSLGGSFSHLTATTFPSGIVKIYGLTSGDKNILYRGLIDASDPHTWGSWQQTEQGQMC